MIALWMLRLLLATALLALAARVADEAARGFGWPRRWVWAGAFVLAASLPWLGGLLPGPSLAEALLARFTPTVSTTPAVLADATSFTISAGSDPQWDLVNDVLLSAWILGSMALVLVFGRALWRVRIARRCAGPNDRVDGVEVIHSEALGPAVIGLVHPVIMLPRWVDELPEAERALIVSHEREHVAARDPLLLAGAALIVVAAPWCLPLWWMHGRLRDASETDCDARVLARGADHLLYGRALLRAAGRPRGPAVRFAAALLGGLNVSRLERRILMMTQQRPKHPVLRAVPLIAVAAVAAVIACDAASDAVGGPVDREAEGASNRAERERPVVIRQASDAAAVNRQHRISEDGSLGAPLKFESEAATPDTGSATAAPDTVVVVGVGNDHAQAQSRRRDALVSDGLAGSAPVFYIDGERVEDGASALGELDPTMIERIEVFKGAGVALYPPDHAAGVVHIYTKNR